MRFMRGLLTGLFALWMGSAQAALQARDLDHNSITDAYYDTVLDITWLRNVTYAAGSVYDNTGTPPLPYTNTNTDGFMTWQNAMDWVGNLSFGGFSNWRLPTRIGAGKNGTGMNMTFAWDGSTDRGYNITNTNSELSYMWYVNLGNIGEADKNGNCTATGLPPSPSCPAGYNGMIDDPNNAFDENLFDNLVAVRPFWYDISFTTQGHSNYAACFRAAAGFQTSCEKTPPGGHIAWAVHDGDIGSSVPEPGTMLLAGLALAGLGAARRRRSFHA